MFSYIESRGGRYERTVFFGLQILLKEYLSKPVTPAMVDEAEALFAAHGEPFDAEGWRYVIEQYGGYLPLRIRAVPEGLVVPGQNVLVTVECTDPRVFWLASYVETLLLRIWYPITVATQSWAIKARIRRALVQSSDDPAGQLPFKLHDFGARGVSSAESAAIGGCAHLVNFLGTDTVSALLAARAYYGEPMAGFSIPAAEHSTITAWGRENEVAAYRNMLGRFAKPGAILAVVSDSYDIFNACDALWGQALKQAVVDSGAVLVVRPDSGDPVSVVLQVARLLAQRFGVSTNRKGYKVLNHVRIIQGDGVNGERIGAILDALLGAGFSADNVAFGMGGALLQQLNRDTLKFAMKCSAVRVAGEWRDVFKDPVTDAGKASKKGRLTLLRNRESGEFLTVRLCPGWQERDSGYPVAAWQEVLEDVWDSGCLLKDHSFADIRQRAEAG